MGNVPAHHSNKVALLIIDPQIDFHPGGTMPIAGAQKDSERTAEMIRTHCNEIDEIYVTLDSHHRNHIAHGIFWENEHGEHPKPYTLIGYADVGTKWWPRDRRHMAWCLQYTSQLAENNRFMLCIWPEHCLIGTTGHAIVPVLNDALQYWAGNRLRSIRYLHKGMNNLTEMYSCIQADVPIDTDPATRKNTEMLKKLLRCKRLMICGQSSSHSVHFTTTDLLFACPVNHEERIVLLIDAISPSLGCEEQARAFIEYVESKGVLLSTTKEIFTIPCLPVELHRRDSQQSSRSEKSSLFSDIGQGGSFPNSSQKSVVASLDGSNRGSSHGHARHNSYGGEQGGVSSSPQQASSSLILRSMSASILSLGITDDDDPNEETISGKHLTSGSGSLHGKAMALRNGSITTISNCDTSETSMGVGERETKTSRPSVDDDRGDILSNSIHGLMNVGTNVGTLLNPLNPFTTSQKN